MADRNLVRVPISLEFFVRMVTEGAMIDAAFCAKGIPAGAKFVGSSYDPRGICGYLFFEHESFAPVKEGGIIPELLPEFVSGRPE